MCLLSLTHSIIPIVIIRRVSARLGSSDYCFTESSRVESSRLELRMRSEQFLREAFPHATSRLFFDEKFNRKLFGPPRRRRRLRMLNSSNERQSLCRVNVFVRAQQTSLRRQQLAAYTLARSLACLPTRLRALQCLPYSNKKSFRFTALHYGLSLLN